MSRSTFKCLSLALCAVALSACATTPSAKNIQLPKSALSAPQKSVDGSAIAFQASTGRCFDSSFEISPRLSDGKYGDAQRLEFSNSTFKFPTKGLNQTKFASSRKHLYVKKMAPGSYVITRIKCTDSQSLKNGTKYTNYFTNPERIDIFGEFDIVAGQTTYVGAIETSFTRGGPTFRVSDKSSAAETFFNENYADKTGAFSVGLIDKKKP